MRSIPSQTVIGAVADLCVKINYQLGDDVLQALEQALREETSSLAREVLGEMLENAKIASQKQFPLCQDTGIALVFAEIGDQVRITGATLLEAVSAGVKKGYAEGYLRNSVVADPLRRENTGDNTPPALYTEIVAGEKLLLQMAAKGGGGENKSRSVMLEPADGPAGVEAFVLETVRKASGSPCPPLVVGVGLGGLLDGCAVASKKALLRPLGSLHPDPYYAQMEKSLKEKINGLGIGPMGLGGKTTALAVHIEARACHIASLPAAVTLNCHSHRHGQCML